MILIFAKRPGCLVYHILIFFVLVLDFSYFSNRKVDVLEGTASEISKTTGNKVSWPIWKSVVCT